MRPLGRVLSFGALVLLLLALPGLGLAANPNPFLGPVSGPSVSIPGGPAVTPTLVPGAAVGAVGTADVSSYSAVAGATVVGIDSSGTAWEYNSGGGPLLAPLGLPAGATLWQIDVYGYTTGATFQLWGVVRR